MLKKITRRHFVSSLSVMAAMPLLSPRAARAANGRTVSVEQYNNSDWIAAFKQAFSEADTVVVPDDLVCDNINTGIFIPDGKTLLIRGGLKGNGRGRFVLQEGSKVIGEGEGRTHNITLDVRGSDCVIKGLAMSGFGPVTQIYIGGKKPRVMR
ncbi:colanic acid biosynthesis protein WcaM, partial [Escherichia coli]|nr:colanic acid biosynthesis protein WcaM [Escherichia coli]